MIINGIHVDSNDYFDLVEGTSTKWRCKIRGCRAEVVTKSRPAHLRLHHYRIFGMTREKENVIPPAKNRTAWIRWYNSTPGNRKELEVQ